MNAAPKVSIVLPTYNRAKYLHTSIDSCLNQTFKDFELIIVDDCSTDDTTQIVQNYTDPRIRYHRNSTNQRLPRSLNIGFSLARGNYFTWTSDDNFYTPEAIERMLKCLEENNGDFVYTDIFDFDENDIKGARHQRLPDAEEIKIFNCIRACFLYTRKVRDMVGEYDPDKELIEDYDYWIRIWQRFHLYHVKEPLYYYRFHSEALWSANSLENFIRFYILRFKYNFISQDLTNWHLRELKRKKQKLNWLAGYLQIILDCIFYKRKIGKILKDYKTDKLTFNQTRNIFNQLIKTR